MGRIKACFGRLFIFFKKEGVALEKYFNAIAMAVSVIGGVVVGWLGGMDVMLHALMVLVVVDYVTGLAKAIKLHELDSRVGFFGLIRKVLIFVVVAVAVEMEKVLGNAIPLREIVIMFYVANEGISFLENISEFLNFPQKMKDVFTQIRDKSDEKANEEEIK